MKNIKFTEMRTELAPNQVRKFAHDEFPDATMGDYNSLGVSFAEDADADGVLTQAGFTPLQYLQFPLNKPIEVLTTPTVADKICGRSIVANWETEEVIQPIVEGAGVPGLYGDDNDTPLASFDNDYEKRTVQRFELGIRVGKLEDARMAKMNVLGFKSPYDTKRSWLARAFQLQMDEIAFRGFANGASCTFGLLSDPNLAEAASVATVTKGGADVTKWSGKDYQEITADIREMFAALNDQTDTHFDGMAGDACMLVLDPLAKSQLTRENDMGKSVLKYIEDNYSGCEIIAAPRFRDAYAPGVGFGMLIAKDLDSNKVVDQFVPTLMRLLGVFKSQKHVQETYTYATAGVMVKQPLGIVCRFGM